MLLKGVKLLSLDATNTLIRLRQVPAVTYAEVAREFGFQRLDQTLMADRFLKAFRRLEKERPCYGFHSGGAKEWWTDLMRVCYGREIAESDSFPALADRVFAYYRTREAWCLTDEQNLDLLRSLSSSGLKIVVISNFDQRLHDILRHFGLDEFIDHVIISADVGFQKPDPAIFKLALERFKITDPSKFLHIGDHVEKDFLAASALGINALLLAENPPPNVPKSRCIRSIVDLLYTNK